jgi:prophage antirepressor-like protein
MTNSISFKFDHTTLSVQVDDNGEPWFCASEVCDALGFANPWDAVSRHVDRDDLGKREVIDSLGRKQQANHINESGLYALILGSTKPEAKRFKKLVTSQILPSIRKTGTYTAKSAITPLKATAEGAKAFAPLVRVARLLGCDKNAAAISANQAIYSMTNINLMQQLGRTHMEAEQQDGHWYTPTELGKQMTPAVSARQVNLLLAEAGLQFKRGDVWEATEAGKDFARIYDTGKRHGSGVAVTQMKWSATVLGVLQALPVESKEAA